MESFKTIQVNIPFNKIIPTLTLLWLFSDHLLNPTPPPKKNCTGDI